MKNNLIFAGFLLLFSCGFLISCAREEITVEGCKYEQYRGFFTIENTYSEFDGRHNRTTVNGTFNPDDSDAPPELKQAKLKQSLGYPEEKVVSRGEKYRVKLGYLNSGSCSEKMILNSPENWR